MKQSLTKALIITSGITLGAAASALDWQTNEVHYQYGDFDVPTFAGGGSEHAHIGTVQHASGWKYGDTFAFADYSDGSESGHDIYGEVYANFSLGKITGNDISFGPVKDMGIIAGFNGGKESGVRKWLPGVRFAMDAPGFNFLNVDVTAYIDDNLGGEGRAPTEDDSYMVDVSWALPFNIGNHKFSVEGHMEYIGERDNEYGDTVEGHFLAQPQVRYDLGKTMFGKEDKLFVGVEFQFWNNKLGDKDTDERVTQFLAVYRL